jgi:chaperone modulatory protein CbpM
MHMAERYTQEQVVAAIPRLTLSRLVTFIEAEVVVPARSEAGLVFTQVDVARMELLCELEEGFDLDEEALGIVISLIDQLHAMRRDLCAIARAVEAEPAEVRARIGAALRDASG